MVSETMRRIGELLQSGQYSAAHEQLESWVAANPQDVEGLRLLAGTKQVLGDPVQAEALLRRALHLDATWPPTLTTLAELLLATGRTAEAIPLLQRAVRGSPRAALLLARQYLDAGQPAAALDIAAPWCNSGKADIELAGLHVAAYAALGRQSEAVAHYRSLVALAPQNPVAAYALAAALHASEQTEEGERVARQTLLRGRPSAALYDTHARSLITLERFDEAEQALRECLRLEPRRAEAHDRLAQLVWMRTGDIREATRELDRALVSYPHDDALWATKASVLQGAGDPRGALACLTERAARPQSHPNLLIRAGLAALEFEPATALALAERALQAQPGNPTARKLLCGAYLGVGEARKALTECLRLLEVSPDDQYLIAMQTTALRLLRDVRYEVLCDYDRMVFSMYLEPPAGYASRDSFLTELAAHLEDLHSPHGHPLL
jgi:tetratricopeptide (TPR) repeat protein